MKEAISNQQSAVSDVSAALRHVVYRDLMMLLPIASVEQTEQFAANLALCRNKLNSYEPSRVKEKTVRNVLKRLRLLRVSPDIATATNYPKLSKGEIEIFMADKFGDRLKIIAGFYFKNRWRVNLPESCAFIEYRSSLGFNRGVMCQPTYSIDSYFLLSSSKFDGPKALRMEQSDRDFFESFKDPVIYKPPPCPEWLRLKFEEMADGESRQREQRQKAAQLRQNVRIIV